MHTHTHTQINDKVWCYQTLNWNRSSVRRLQEIAVGFQKPTKETLGGGGVAIILALVESFRVQECLPTYLSTSSHPRASLSVQEFDVIIVKGSGSGQYVSIVQGLHYDMGERRFNRDAHWTFGR